MIGAEDAQYTYEYAEHYKILPAIHNWSADAHAHQGRPARRRRLRLLQRQQSATGWTCPRCSPGSPPTGTRSGRSDVARSPTAARMSTPPTSPPSPRCCAPTWLTQGPGRAALRAGAGRVLRCRACRCGQQRHVGAAHRLPGARARARRLAVDQPDHLPRVGQLRAATAARRSISSTSIRAPTTCRSRRWRASSSRRAPRSACPRS